MPATEQFTSIINYAVLAFFLTGVAVMVSRTISHHSIPWEDKVRLSEKYGTWAVNRSESFCPENDVACVEREAKRLIDTYKYRREL